MTIFYQGDLQSGIALAVREAKAVVCFVRDEAEKSSTWENEYFAGEKISQVLDAKAVLLRLAAGSQEAGFLASFCPIVKFPTVVVIRNGTMAEYLVPEVSKEDFQNRLVTAVTKDNSNSAQPVQNTSIPGEGNNSSAAVSTPQSASPVPPSRAPVTSPAQNTSQSAPAPQQVSNTAKESTTTKKPIASKGEKEDTIPEPQPRKENQTKQAPKPKRESKLPGKAPQESSSATRTEPGPVSKAPTPRGPPTQYRLQVRLFDGRSVRSNFTPDQKIGTDVRRWLDSQMGDEQRPYSLKHVLTPLPSRTLSVSEESQPLQNLGLGSTANLAMIPVATYTEAYATTAASLPLRGVSAVYNAVSSVASSTTGFIGSLIYGSNEAPQNEDGRTVGNIAANPSRPRPAGTNIRTLNDQQNERGDRQLYNGNQLNFEPRQDRKDE
ncbi:hypothetical protein N7468_009083 [Penicillium chermesinum]|uniref:UBX domain-containing protein 2 n=1 Tax=Penicillium chermesinum TaxID=63820 RepID=A0A9W9NJL9_9EURO|nr:uncharacterized protein N7468_009083 [Penicillium chermesinum]KAJ5219879.1 hypothetical protein N7468_009083 [Penicillium chermesinum]KAJ6157339.1 hypothetical protein N7470_004931 [Penicillium chermesinum]